MTGASSGIGEELSKQLSLSGSKIVCAARRLPELERVCSIINDSGGDSIAVKTDITILEQCVEMVNVAIKHMEKLTG